MEIGDNCVQQPIDHNAQRLSIHGNSEQVYPRIRSVASCGHDQLVASSARAGILPCESIMSTLDSALRAAPLSAVASDKVFSCGNADSQRWLSATSPAQPAGSTNLLNQKVTQHQPTANLTALPTGA